MAYTTFEIKKYRIALFSSGAKVNLFDIGGVNVGNLYFRPEVEALPASYLDEQGIYRLYFHRSELRDVVDMLRNEAPAYLHVWDLGGNNTHLSTGREPVGEGELNA
jgi:hypothetical protein